jgi:hypothetical protein
MMEVHICSSTYSLYQSIVLKIQICAVYHGDFVFNLLRIGA